MTDIISIRDAVEQDADSLAALAAQLGYPSSGAEVGRRMVRYAGNPGERIIVAEEGGRVVGWTSVAVVDHFYTALYVEISGLVVDADHRSRGIGSLLLDEVKRWAKEKAVPLIRLRANVLRKEAHRFYEREGFSRVKEQVVFETKTEVSGR